MVLAQQLLACLEVALQAPHPQPIAPAYVMLRAGGEVTPLLGTTEDECCRGLGWVRIAGLSGVRDVNDLDTTAQCFGSQRVLVLELGVARCAPSAPVSSVPTEDQWTTVALLLDADMGAMEQAICCAFGGDAVEPIAGDVAVGEYVPFGVDGNCIGGTMTVRIALERCC